jgi:hypothetical protein
MSMPHSHAVRSVTPVAHAPVPKLIWRAARLLLPAFVVFGAQTASANIARTCYPASADVDRDGYAVSGTPGTTQMVDALLCPSGYVNRAGDCNDRNAAVHPRRHEVTFNSVDDDCDGRTDEPEPVYPANPYSITFYWGFWMPVRFNRDELQYAKAMSLNVRVDVHDFWDNKWFSMDVVNIKASDISSDGVVNLWVTGPGGLYELSVYEAVAHFLNARGQEISASDPYIVMTDPYYTENPWTEDRLERARYWIVNRALYEESLSRYGEVGYRGTLRVDGTRYGAPSNRLWCSEFYSWTSSPNLNGSGGKTTVAQLKDYFASYGAWYAPSAGQPGDYLGLDTDGDGKKNHSGMVLSQTGAQVGWQWTIEGNVSDEVRIQTRNLTGPSVVGRGGLKASMLR